MSFVSSFSVILLSRGVLYCTLFQVDDESPFVSTAPSQLPPPDGRESDMSAVADSEDDGSDFDVLNHPLSLRDRGEEELSSEDDDDAMRDVGTKVGRVHSPDWPAAHQPAMPPPTPPRPIQRDSPSRSPTPARVPAIAEVPMGAAAESVVQPAPLSTVATTLRLALFGAGPLHLQALVNWLAPYVHDGDSVVHRDAFARAVRRQLDQHGGHRPDRAEVRTGR